MPIDGDIILKAGLDTTGVSKSIGNLSKSISKGLKNAIRVAFGVRSVFALIRKIRSAVMEGFENLAQVHQPFNQAMSEIMTSLNLLKNTFAAAFAPIIETVAPIVTTFINLIAKAVASVGQFIAALTGKEYVTAGQVQVDYAQSVDKSTKSTKSSTKATKAQTQAQKKLNREITHFDDLVILHEKEDTDKATTPTTTTTPSVAFSTAPIGQAVNKFAKDFKAAWAKADFTDIGRLVGEKIKNALERIPWTNIKTTLAKIATSVATFLNGYFETPGLYYIIGKTIAQGINSAFVFLYNFVHNFHWDSWGTAIRNKILGAVENIEWLPIYRTFNDFGVGLARFLNELFDEHTFEEVGATIAQMLNVALTFLNRFGEKFDFKGFGNSIAAGINKLLARFDENRLTAGINKFVIGFRDAIISFLSRINWYQFGLKIRNIILGINWKQVLLAVGAVIWTAINSAITFFKGLFDADNISTPFTTALNDLSTTISTAASQIDFDSLERGFSGLVKALAPAIEGFGIGFTNFFKVLAKIGIEFFNKLGPALEVIATAINLIPPEVLEKIGEAFGVLAAAFVTISLFNGAVGIIGKIASPLATLATNAGNAATAIGIGSTGLVGALWALSAALLGVSIGMKLGEVSIADTTEELAPYNEAHETTLELLKGLQQQYGLTDRQVYELAWEMQGLTDDQSDFAGVMALVDRNVQNAGINVDDFKTSLSEACTVAKHQGKDISTVETYIKGVGETATTSEENTSEFAGVFDVFNGLSISTPIKLALLTAAIKALGDKGSLSEEDINNLYGTLDAYKADPTEKNMKRVQDAFEKTGLSADEFVTTVAMSMGTLDPEVQKEVQKALKSIKSSGKDIKKQSKETFENVGEGGKEGLKSKEKDVKNAAGELMEGTFDELNDVAESNSPSKRARRLGGYIGQGLQLGMNDTKSKLTTTANTIITAIFNQMHNKLASFKTLGTQYMTQLNSGINKMSNTLSTTANTVITNMRTNANSLSFWNVGYNIGTGIYNGLVAQSSRLNTLAWNTAVGMYNSAAKALDIHSPSKKFAWIGEMVASGLGKGILDNQGMVVNAVTDMTDAMTQEAEKTNPAITISSSIDDWITSLDDVLTTFSETIISRFDNMMNTLIQLSNVSGVIPAVAEGTVVPSSWQSVSRANDNSTNMARMLENLTTNQVTTDDLRSLLVEMFTEYMNLGWYVGDEQLARHVNNGNLLLGRRYSK